MDALNVKPAPPTNQPTPEPQTNRSTPGGAEGADLVDRLLVLDPGQRLTADQALDHDYLWAEDPLDPRSLPPLKLRKAGQGGPGGRP